MLDFRGKQHLVKYLGIVTGEQFEELYNEMTNSDDKLPVASTILPLGFKDGVQKVQAWIFYEVIPKEEPVPEKKLSLEL